MRALVLPPVSCWTGSVAAWAPFPPQQQQAAGAGLPPLKSSSGGVWLKSDAGGVLTVQWHPKAPPLLLCTLRRNVELVRAPLLPGGFAFKLLCPRDGRGAATGGNSGHLLLLSLAASGTSSASMLAGQLPQQQQQQQQRRTIAVHFDTAQAGRECGALLQAIQVGQLQTDALPAAAPLPTPVPFVATTTAPAIADAKQQQQQQQQQQGVAPTGSGPVSGELATGRASEAAVLFGYPDEVSLVAALQLAQVDPEFLAYVEQLERAVAAVERLLLGQGQ